MSENVVPRSPSEIILLRHGETQWNRAGRYQGQKDSPLTLAGIGQIRAIAQTLRSQVHHLTRYQIWSSPLTRTRQSISVFCEELGLSYGDIHVDDRLMERNYGRWEGCTMNEITERFPEDIERESADRWNFAVPGGGESFAAVADRLRNFLDDRSGSGDGPIIVMSHGGAGRVLRGIYTGVSPQDIFAFNDPQSSAFMMSNGASTTLNATAEALRAFGCDDAGLGVRI